MATVIKYLWPSDVKSKEVLSPIQILRVQGDYLKKGTDGAIEADVLTGAIEGRTVINFDLVSSGKRVRILSAQHQPGFEYPVRVFPPDFSVPGYLQKNGRAPAELTPAMNANETVDKDYWLCESPDEFMAKVESILKSSSIKSIVLSLIANAAQTRKRTKSP